MSILPIQPQDAIPVLKEIAPKINPKTLKIVVVVAAIAYVFFFFIIVALIRYIKLKPMFNFNLKPLQQGEIRGVAEPRFNHEERNNPPQERNDQLREDRQMGMENIFEAAQERIVPEENPQPVPQDLFRLLENRHLTADDIFNFSQNIPDDQRATFFEGRSALHHLISQDHLSEELIIALLAICPDECKLSQFAPNHDGKTPLDEALSLHQHDRIINALVDAYPIHDEGFFEFIYPLVEGRRFTFEKFRGWINDLWGDIHALPTPAQVIYLHLAQADDFEAFIARFNPVKFASGKIQTLLQKPLLFKHEILELDGLLAKQSERIREFREIHDAWEEFVETFNEGERVDLEAILKHINEQDAPDELCDAISFELMDDPVQLPSQAGNITIVDRTSAENLNEHPVTREPLDLDKLIPRPDIKAKIYDWMEPLALEWRRQHNKLIRVVEEA